MIVTTNRNGYNRKFVQGGGSIWTSISRILGKIFSSAAAKTAKNAAQDIGKAALEKTGEKAVKAAKDKLAKILASRPAKKAKHSMNDLVIQENPSKGSGPSIGSTLTNGLGIKII